MLAGLFILVGLATVAAAAPALGAAVPGSSRWVWQNPLPTGDELGDVSCPSQTVCYVAGMPGTLLVTTDGGATWSSRRVGVAGPTGAIECPTTLACFLSEGNVILHTTDGGQSWSRQTSPINPSPPAVAAVGPFSCPTSTTCFAPVRTGSIHPGPGYIIATTDGGSTWVNQTPDGIGQLGSIDCADSKTCYASGGFGEVVATKDGTTWAAQNSTVNEDLGQISCRGPSFCAIAGPGNEVITTSNGGANWTVHSTVVTASGTLTGMSCPTPSVCMATGMDNASTANMIAIRSTNGGATWQTSYPPTIPGWLNRVDCPSTTTCIAVGRHGWIAVTNDSGTTWSTPSSGTSMPLHAVSCPTERVCFAAGDAGIVLATTNGGRTWNATPSGASTNLRGISCADASNCTAVGLAGTAITTTDGGAHWSSITSGTTQDLFGVSCPTATHCVAVGGNYTVLVVVSGAVQSSPTASAHDVLGVSCPSATTCFLVGSMTGLNNYGAIEASIDGGTTWQTRQSNDVADIQGISCAVGTTACAAVDTFGNMLSSQDAVSWSVHQTPTTWLLHAVTCSAPDACLAVSTAGEIISTADGGVTSRVLPLLTANELFGVSCPSVAACTVVGANGTILATPRPRPMAPALPTAGSAVSRTSPPAVPQPSPTIVALRQAAPADALRFEHERQGTLELIRLEFVAWNRWLLAQLPHSTS